MKLEEDYKGFHQWKDRARQHIHAGKGEGLIDVIRYMRDHLKSFGFDDELTFDEREIVQEKSGHYIVTLRSKPKNGRNVIRPGLAPELEAASKK
jgi:hypothetical protein